MEIKPEAPDIPPRNPLRIMSGANTNTTSTTTAEKTSGSIDLGNKTTNNETTKSPNSASQVSPIGEPPKVNAEKSPTTATTEMVEIDVKNNNSDVKYDKGDESTDKDNEGKIECKENDQDSTPQSINLQDENKRLSAEVVRLKQMIDDGATGSGADNLDTNSLEVQSNDSSSSNKIERLENELRIAKELIQSLKAERKKLRSDKSDLLQQVKHLCASLQEKEQELRNFIRNFEQRIRDSEAVAAKASSDSEHDRWTLIKHAHDEAERSLALAAQLNVRDMQLQRVSEQLMEARRQLGIMPEQEGGTAHNTQITSPSGILNHGCDENELNVNNAYVNTTPGDRGSCSADSGVRGSSDRESAAGDMNLSDGACENETCITVDSDSISLVSSHHNMNQYGSPSVSPMNTLAMERTSDKSINYSRNVMELPVDLEGASSSMARRLKSKPFNSLVGRASRGGAWGSISRVFARSKNRKSASQEVDSTGDFQWNSLTEESYAEKIRLLREASSTPFENWRVPQILAWLEIALGMPKDCIRLCSENVKSGKVLLELSDAELESGLGATHPMHRKKLRLAIEEQRRPDLIRYPMIGQLGHSWTALEWLHDIGLSQYSESFLHSLVDARMLDTLSKKELEKYLGVTRKFHQASIVHGIHLLRLMKYDRQSLAMRRMQCENNDSDPIVWTNQRFIRWVRSIDLGEYAENLRNSGVHGGLVVLETSFSGETMATALGIPPSKNIVRRHLMTEFDSMIIPARATLTQGFRAGTSISVYERHANGSLSKSYVNPKVFKTGGNHNKNIISPTHSYSSSEGGYGLYTGMSDTSNRIKGDIHDQPFLAVMSSQFSMNHRISAPPTMSENNHSTLPRYVDHRRVKSISDIETAATNTHNQTNCSQTSVNKIVNSTNEYAQKN